MFGGGFAGLFEIIIRLRTIAFICDRPSSVERWWARRTAKAYCIAAKREVTKKTEEEYMYAISYVLSLQRSMPAAYLFPSEYPSFGPRSSLFSGPGATEPASSAVAAEERVVA